MENKALESLRIAIPLTIVGFVAFTDNYPVLSQLTPDNTLGTENSIVTPQQLRDLIQGGAIRDNTLFHSFDEFNVENGGSVFFDLQNNADILNIFTRVTGSNSSSILGTLGVLQDALNSNVLGNANLFLLNPNGISFGGNANLQLNGSFFATTADGFGFDNFTFSASGEEAPPPLLTVSIPRFLSFRDNPGRIVNQSVARDGNGNLEGLQVQAGETLGLIGGEVELLGGGIVAPDARVEIGGVGGNGLVSLTETDAGFVLGYEGIEAFQDITFNQFAFVNTSGEGGGSIQLQGRDIRLSDGSLIFADTNGFENGDGILINVEQLILKDESLLTADVSGSGQGGDLTINVIQLLIQDGSLISASTFGGGNTGNLLVNASDSVQVIGRSADSQFPSALASQASFGSGDAGNLTINTSQLIIQDGALVLTSTVTQGNAGNLLVNASDSIQVIGTFADNSQFPSGLSSQASLGSVGDAGNLTINTSQLIIQDGAQVNSATFGEGEGGNLAVSATSIQLVGRSADSQFPSGLSTQAGAAIEADFLGNAGDFNVYTSNLLIKDGAVVSSSTFGEGNSGNLTVNATDSIQVIGTSEDSRFPSALDTQANPGSTGNAGDLNITTPSLLIQDGAQIRAGTFGEGNGGNLTVNATNSIQVIGESANGQISTSLSAQANPGSTGNAGNLNITTPSLLIQSGARVSTGTFGEGSGGDLKLNVNDTILIEGIGSGIFSRASAGSTGNPGNVTIDPQQVTVRDGGAISINSLGRGTGGNIFLTSDNLTLENGSITAQTANTDGGNITLDIADLLLLRNGSGNALISATAGGQGNGGNLSIDTTFLVAFPNENSDITANANLGNGGNVKITATEIYGIEFQEIPTELSDITASSEFGLSGTVNLNTPETQVNQEQIEPPEDVVDSSDIVSQSACYDFGGDSQLANTGRGGVPQIPGFIIRNDVVDVELVDEVLLPAPPPEAIKPHHRTTVTYLNSEGEEVKPAMGAVLLPNGMVEFVDYSPAEVYRDMYAAAGCNRLSNE